MNCGGGGSLFIVRPALLSTVVDWFLRPRSLKKNKYESLNYAKVMNQSYHNAFIHTGPDRIDELKKYRLRCAQPLFGRGDVSTVLRLLMHPRC